MTNNNWTRDVFDINQLMFPIWQYLAFPACLRYAAVHSHWCERLWPVSIIPKRGKETIFQLGLKRRRAAMIFVPATLESVSISSAHAVITPSKAMISNLPVRKYHMQMLPKQLFNVYNHIATLELCGNEYKTKLCMNIENVELLLSEWQQRTLKTVNKHLILNHYRSLDVLRMVQCESITLHTRSTFLFCQIQSDAVHRIHTAKHWNIHFHSTVSIWELATCFGVLRVKPSDVASCLETIEVSARGIYNEPVVYHGWYYLVRFTPHLRKLILRILTTSHQQDISIPEIDLGHLPITFEEFHYSRMFTIHQSTRQRLQELSVKCIEL